MAGRSDFAVPSLSDVALDRVLDALAEPMRRGVVASLYAASADVERPCSSFDLPVAKSTRTHHWRVLREAGLIRQRDVGNGSVVRLRAAEIEERFPGLLGVVCGLDAPTPR